MGVIWSWIAANLALSLAMVVGGLTLLLAVVLSVFWARHRARLGPMSQRVDLCRAGSAAVESLNVEALRDSLSKLPPEEQRKRLSQLYKDLKDNPLTLHYQPHLESRDSLLDTLAACATQERGASRHHLGITYPREVPKGETSRLMVAVYVDEKRGTWYAEVKRSMRRDGYVLKESAEKFDGSRSLSVSFDATDFVVRPDQNTFSSNRDIQVFRYQIRPTAECKPGPRDITIQIKDVETGAPLASQYIEVEVVDYAFGKVPKSVVNRLGTALAGGVSLVMFTLSVLQQVDSTVGVAGGTSAAAVTAVFAWGLLPNKTTTA